MSEHLPAGPGNDETKTIPYRAMALVAFVLMFLSVFGVLDYFAKVYVEQTRNESIGIYAISKSINAGISVLQSSQVKMPFVASLQVGEVLDPINDAVERLSTAMAWAIGSLFLQQIVLEVISNWFFKLFFLVTGLATISALLLIGWEHPRNLFSKTFNVSELTLAHYCNLLVRILIVSTILRFIVPAVVIISFLVSQMLLGTEIKQHKKNLSTLNQKVPIDKSMSSLDDQRLVEQRRRKGSELDELQKSRTIYKQEYENLDKKIDRLNKKAGWSRWVPEFLGGEPPGNELISAKARQKSISRKMEATQERIYAIENDLECIKRKIVGQNCDSWLDKLSNKSKAIYRWLTRHGDISEISDKANEMATSIIILLAAIVIKNILIPLSFLAIAIKGSLPIARYSMRLVSGLKRDSKELQRYLDRGD